MPLRFRIQHFEVINHIRKHGPAYTYTQISLGKQSWSASVVPLLTDTHQGRRKAAAMLTPEAKAIMYVTMRLLFSKTTVIRNGITICRHHKDEQ